MAVFFCMAEKEQAPILNKILRFCVVRRVDEKRTGIKLAEITRDHQPDVL
jgi:hypothetical protein